MDRILIVLKKENGPRASSAPALGLNTIIFKIVYWHMKQISGERLQDHWSSVFFFFCFFFCVCVCVCVRFIRYVHVLGKFLPLLRLLTTFLSD